MSHAPRMMCAMQTISYGSHFSGAGIDARPCWHCHHWDGWASPGAAAYCSNPAGSRVRGQPENGCVQFEREPGADDEMGVAMLCDHLKLIGHA